MQNNDISHFDRKLGRKVREARRRAGLTQSQLGEMVGVTYQQIQKYERGDIKLSAARLSQLMSILHMPLTYFLDDESTPADLTTNAAAMRLVAGIEALPNDKIRQDIRRLVKSINHAWTLHTAI